MIEDEAYKEYLEEEIRLIREFLDTYDQYNSGSLSDDVIELFKSLS